MQSKRCNITNILDAKPKTKIKWFSEHYHRNNTRTFHRNNDLNFQIEEVY